jgi:Flp pilus assembly protein TadB
VIGVVLAGAAAGAGLLLLVRALHPARATLADQLAAYDAARHRPAGPATHPAVGWFGHARAGLGDWLSAQYSERGWLTGRLRADLAATDRTLASFLLKKVVLAGAGLMLLPVVLAAAATAGLGVPALIPAWLAITAAVVGFLVPDLRLRGAAAAARRDFRAAITAFLDLTAMRMASGAGLGEALGEAARVGSGPAFAALRTALADARTDGLSPAAALGRLGSERAVDELTDTAARLALVGDTGAQAEASLRAQAASMRHKQRADMAGRAGERTQSMRIAQLVLGFGFLIFLIYPAISKVLAF